MDNLNEAIKTIQEYCGSFKICTDGCCFYDKGTGCMFAEAPTPEE